MRRLGLIIPALAVLAWGIAAAVTGSPGLGLGSGRHSSGQAAASPPCLPDGYDHSALLAGTSVTVSPEPDSQTANPHSQISFLGTTAGAIADLTVTGARSGRHSGRLRAYSQGDGASFVPEAPFEPGEHVEVHALIGTGPAARAVSWGFDVDTPYPTGHTGEFPHPGAPKADYQSFATMPGAEIPLLTVGVPDHDPAAGDIFTTNGPGPGQYGPLIYTPQGRVVWFDPLEGGETAEDLNVQDYEGHQALTWWRGRVLSLGFGQGEDLVMNDRYQVIARIRESNGLKPDLHEFQIAAGAVAYITAFNPIRCDLRSVQGVRDGAIIDTAVQEVDMRTGLVRWEWHSLDHVPPSESETPAPTDPTPWDWFHINSIDPNGGDVLISARNTWAIYQIRSASGRILWKLGGNATSFKMGPGTATAWQHDARILPDGEVTIFDDGSNPPIHRQSRAIRIALDLHTHTARLVSSLTHSPPLLSVSQGNYQTLPDGSSLVDFGSIPQITEYSPGGAVLFDAHLSYDLSSYRGFRHPWVATPAAPPTAVASLNSTGEETIVHASWNGATDVAAWRVLAGPRPGALSAQATMSDSGFESSTVIPREYAFVAVQALGTSGRPLAVSQPAKVLSYERALREGQ